MFHEHKTFTLRFSLEAAFPDDYEGELDNHAWVAEWEQLVKPELIRLVFDSVRRHYAWSAHVRNRGLSPADEIEIVLNRNFAGTAATER